MEINPFDEETMRKAFERNTSENRFEALASPELIRIFNDGTRRFQSQHSLSVQVTKKANEIPNVSPKAIFKYSHHGSERGLEVCSDRITAGEDLVIALVWKGEILIGYGIAIIRENECEILIIDVDDKFKRKTGLTEKINFAGEIFQLGVGHVIVKSLIEKCPRPITVDSTTDSSRYIFKSLGFVAENESNNPCILRMD